MKKMLIVASFMILWLGSATFSHYVLGTSVGDSLGFTLLAIAIFGGGVIISDL